MLRLLIEPIVRAALAEDLGRAGDITSDAVVPAEARIDAMIAARQSGVLAGLDAAILIKDNHVALAGGVGPALERARAHAGHLVKIEIEVDTLAQLEEALPYGFDAVLLDNMDPDQLRRAVAMVGGRAVTEASGRITRETAPAIAAAGVDLISSGWITHSAPILDLGLDVLSG